VTALGIPLLRAAVSSGKVAFHYAALFDDSKINWYTRFRSLVTGGLLSHDQSRRLVDRGCRLVAYEWSSGFYPGDWVSAEQAWQNTVQAHPDWLLNSQPVGGGAAMPGKTALWYDFGNPDFRSTRAAYLAERVRTNGYSGVFLDTLGFEYLPPENTKCFHDASPGCRLQ
jgi:hypothetical protein